MLNIPQTILHRLAAADRAHQKESAGFLLLRSVKYVCAFILAVFVLDVLLHWNAGWRFTMSLVFIVGVLALLALGWYLAFIRRSRLERIARFLETRDPALGSRLINLLQLSEQTADHLLAPMTRDLARQAVENYADELRDAPLEQLARTGEWRRHLQRAARVLLGLAVVLVVFSGITAVEVARFVDPHGDHPPYSFTRLEIVQPGPAGAKVLYGKSFVVRVKASGHQPKDVFLTVHSPDHPEEAITLPMFDKGSVGFDQLVDNIRTELIVFAHTKDRASLSKQARIGVILTPQLEKGFVRIAPPAYTGLKSEEKPYAFKAVQALAGSEVQFRFQSNRPLREGLLEIFSGEMQPQRVVLKKFGENEVAGSFSASSSGRLRFSLTDVAGTPSQGDYQGALTVTHDLPPEIRITEPEHDAFVAMDFKLKAHIGSSDDYGLRAVRLHRGLNGVFSAPKIVSYSSIVRDSYETLDFNFSDLGIQPGDIVSLFAEVVDTAPEPHLARSQAVHLAVISVEEYNNFLRERTDMADIEAKYAALTDDLQELIDQQENLGQIAEKMKREPANTDPKQRDAPAEELDRLIAKQNELNEKLNQHAERMDHFVRENPLYDVERDLQELLRERAQKIRQSTRTNDAAVRKIAQRSSPQEGGRYLSPDLLERFRKESDEQVARLGGVRESTNRRVVGTLADMSLMHELIKDFNRFEALYRVQQELAEQSRAYNRAGQLSREDQLALKELAATEKQVADVLKLLVDKLRRDASAAEKLFPKAARSGRDLADNMDRLRLHPLAEQATAQMLAGDGERSFQLAERLRSEMEKLFKECQGGNCPSGSELDQYLALQQMNRGRNFAQMARSRKFGVPGDGFAQGEGQGEGMMGTSGYAAISGEQINVLGNELGADFGSARARQSDRMGKGPGARAGNLPGTSENPDVVKGLNPVNRQSTAVSSEALIEEYHDVVESYFKSITTKKKQKKEP